MGLTVPKKPALAATVLILVALVLQIVAVAAPGWSATKVGDIDVGLWKRCMAGTCVDLTDQEDYMKAVQAMSIIGVIVLALALVACGAMFFKQADVLPLAAAGLSLLAAVCILIAFAVYAGEGDPGLATLSYCFALSVVACVLSAGAGVLFIIVKVKA